MSVENEKEIQQLKNRIRELADKSYNQNQYTFTGFLGLAEQDALWQVEREVKFAGITLYVGRKRQSGRSFASAVSRSLAMNSPFLSAVSGSDLYPRNLQTSCPTGIIWGH